MNTHSTLPRQRVDRFEDETDSSSISDYDSEWTHVSGADEDSDFAAVTSGGERPLSHLANADDSNDEDIWEGFIEEPDSISETADVEVRQTVAVATGGEGEDLPQRAATFEEDHRINAALNCSVMGTLRSSRSRSATSSLQASMTESQSMKLRLSFPDPLIRQVEDHLATLTDAEVPQSSASEITSDEQPEQTEATSTIEDSTSSFADIGIDSTPIIAEVIDEVVALPDVHVPQTNYPVAASVVIYGSASSVKWGIAEEVLKLGTGYAERLIPLEDEGTSRLYCLNDSAAHLCATDKDSLYVRVIDRTLQGVDMGIDIATPSLAIILLPSTVPPVLPVHALYLPLISRPSFGLGSTYSSAFSEKVVSDSAQYAWEQIQVPPEKLLVLDSYHPEKVVDASELDPVGRSALMKAFITLLGASESTRVDTDQIEEPTKYSSNVWYVVAIVAASLLAAVSIGFRTLIALKGTTPGYSVQLTKDVPTVATQVVVSEAPVMTAEPSTFLSTAFQDYALAVLQPLALAHANTAEKLPAQTTSATVASGSSAMMKTEKVDGRVPKCKCHSKLNSWSDMLRNSNSIAVRPSSALHTLENSFEHTKKGSAAGISRRPGGVAKEQTSLSHRLPTSLSVITNASAVAEVVGKDLRELYAVCDDLLRAVGRQVDQLQTELVNTRKRAHEEVLYRNERAKRNAKRLRHAGERILSRAGTTLTDDAVRGVRDMFDRASENAKRMHGNAVEQAEQRLAGRRRRVEERRQRRAEDRKALSDSRKAHKTRRRSPSGQENEAKAKARGDDASGRVEELFFNVLEFVF